MMMEMEMEMVRAEMHISLLARCKEMRQGSSFSSPGVKAERRQSAENTISPIVPGQTELR